MHLGKQIILSSKFNARAQNRKSSNQDLEHTFLSSGNDLICKYNYYIFLAWPSDELNLTSNWPINAKFRYDHLSFTLNCHSKLIYLWEKGSKALSWNSSLEQQQQKQKWEDSQTHRLCHPGHVIRSFQNSVQEEVHHSGLQDLHNGFISILINNYNQILLFDKICQEELNPGWILKWDSISLLTHRMWNEMM